MTRFDCSDGASDDRAYCCSPHSRAQVMCDDDDGDDDDDDDDDDTHR